MERFRFVEPTTPESDPLPRGATALAHREVPPRLHDLRVGAPLYQVDENLATAINVAISIGAPLLLTGEPGTGKTQLAYYLAWFFGVEADVAQDKRKQPFTLSVKSTTVARDLLYQFDTVEYFRDARVSEGGKALDKGKYIRPGPLWEAIEAIRQGRPAVVLLDEIDKAPRDFPNDLLQELDQFEFVVKETGKKVYVPRNVPPPIVVVTSNSEKALPPAFLRRCVFHHIELDPGLLHKAIDAWRKAQDRATEPPPAEAQVRQRKARDDAAVDSFMRVRSFLTGKEKVPATAELLGWLAALDARGTELSELSERVKVGNLPLLAALVKDRGDLELIRGTRGG